MSEERKRKELLAALTDGLDILVGMEERKEKEKREEEAPRAPDTFSGLLQSFIPLMIIPQLLPLFQQALGQTLSSTTVNVKVESATSIIPIDISASTAIVPIEIRASQATLNVNIQSQTTTLNIRITESVVTLNVNITNTVLNVNVTNSTLNVNIAGSTVTLDVRIAASAVTLNVSVTNASLNVIIAGQQTGVMLDVRIVASAVTLNVNITGSAVTLNVNIASSAVTLNVNVTNALLNVNIASQTTTLNVTVTGNANVVITGQVVDVRLSGFWHAVSGLQKRFFIRANLLKQLELETQLTYTVPPGKRLVITDVKVNIGLSSYVTTGSIRRRYPSTGWDPVAQVPGHTVELYIYRGPIIIYGLSTSIYQPKVSDALPTPLVFTAGQQFRVATLTNVIGTFVIIELNGYEETV
jgi:hypothetical protein